MDEDMRDVGPADDSAAQPDAVSDAVDAIVENEGTEAPEGAPGFDVDALVGRVADALRPSFDAMSERLSAIERAQRDTFANIVRDGGVVVGRGMVEVDSGAPSEPSGDFMDYDLSI